ncbi:MAG: hypothetical protein AAGD18_09790 [Actinomycetota bacterium]
MSSYWLMEPDEEHTSYDEVPWYRRTWFTMLALLLFWPISLLVIATGPIFQKATNKSRKSSDAPVWRSTQVGRLVMLVSFAVLGVIFTIQYAGPIADAFRGDDDPPSRTAAEPAEEVSAAAEPAAEPTVAPSTTTSTTTTTEPPTAEEVEAADTADDAFGAARAEVGSLADAVLGTGDFDDAIALALGDPRVLGFPRLDDAALTGLRVNYDDNDGQPQYAIDVTYGTALTIDEAVAALRAELAARGHVEEEATDETEDGERIVEVDYEPLSGSEFGFEGLSLDVSDDGTGTSVRVFRFLVGGEIPGDTTLLGAMPGTFVTPERYQWVGSGISMLQGDGWTSSDIELVMRAPTPGMTDEAAFAEIESAQVSWEVEEDLGNLLRMGNGTESAYVSVFANDDRTDVTIRSN